MTVDIQQFSNKLAEIYSNIAKPVLDVILYNYQLSRNVGAEGLVLLTFLVQASASACKCDYLPADTSARHYPAVWRVRGARGEPRGRAAVHTFAAAGELGGGCVLPRRGV